MVGGGLVSEEEFWANHARQVAAEEARRLAERPPGLASGMFSPDLSSGTGKVTLTSEDIHSIFTTWPSVRKLYEEKVACLILPDPALSCPCPLSPLPCHRLDVYSSPPFAAAGNEDPRDR